MKRDEENENLNKRMYQIMNMDVDYFKQLYAQPRKYGNRNQNPILLLSENLLKCE